jgi:hypothetical protein
VLDGTDKLPDASPELPFVVRLELLAEFFDLVRGVVSRSLADRDQELQELVAQ